MKKLANHYNGYDYPKYWDNRDYEDLSERIVLNTFFDKINLSKNQKVADIGCGFGRLVSTYLKYTENILLIDPSSDLLKKAKIENKNHRKIEYQCLDVDKLSKVKKSSVDVAVLIRVLHHVNEIEPAFKSINKILKKNGYFILEFANKLHGKDQIKHILKGNFTYPLDIFPTDKRSDKNKKINTINFLNHHPDVVKDALVSAGFEILDVRSVSNFRSSTLKRILPMNLLLELEKRAQKPFASINFGPSSFILSRKI